MPSRSVRIRSTDTKEEVPKILEGTSLSIIQSFYEMTLSGDMSWEKSRRGPIVTLRSTFKGYPVVLEKSSGGRDSKGVLGFVDVYTRLRVNGSTVPKVSGDTAGHPVGCLYDLAVGSGQYSKPITWEEFYRSISPTPDRFPYDMS
jgi:hypothetical protein